MTHIILPVMTAMLVAAAPIASHAKTDAAKVDRLADEYVALRLEIDPTVSYFTDLPVKSHGSWADSAPETIKANEAREDSLWRELQTVNVSNLKGVPQALTYAKLKEQLGADIGIRVCNFPAWNVNHILGWQVSLGVTAASQPVGSPKARSEALQRWSALPRFIEVEIANLRYGLAQGYSAPKPAVVKVLAQIDKLAAYEPEASPLYSPAVRDDDAAFKLAFATVVRDQINPALRRYSEFLRNEYLPKARVTLGVSALPNGEACYRASSRAWSTSDNTPAQTYALGKKTVAANLKEAKALSRKLFGSEDIPTVLKRIDAALDNHFTSEQDIIDYTRARMAASEKTSATLVQNLPSQKMEVRPIPAYQAGTGSSGSYRASPDPAKPGVYNIPAADIWKAETKGSAAITIVHEGWPGHHLQYAIAHAKAQSPLDKLIFNSGYVEGWGRYAETLAEEAGLYDNDYAKIIRRLWPARNMVYDVGIHLYGWTREETLSYMLEAGRFNAQFCNDLIDRIAVMPGQVTAYDTGALEILALREKAKRELGDKFDIREFHAAVLDNGVVPLSTLRQQVGAWVASKKARG
ncbi:MAG: DUF885 domain-containing protein [Caulobacteraceae bacterium]